MRKITKEQFDELGDLSLNDIKDTLQDEVSADRAMEVRDILVELAVSRDVTTKDFLGGLIMTIMSVLGAAASLEPGDELPLKKKEGVN